MTVTATAIMNAQPPILQAADPVSLGMTLLLTHHSGSVPVVDDGGRLVGQFDFHCLLGSLLPKAASLEGLDDLGFLPESLDHLRERLREVADQPVSEHLNPDAHTIESDTPLTEALLKLYRQDQTLAVVDKSGKLLGIVSSMDIFLALQAKGRN